MNKPWTNDELEHVPCDLCQQAILEPLFLRPDGLKVVRCKRCGLAFVAPRPVPRRIAQLYRQDYFQKSGWLAKIGYSDFAEEESRQALRQGYHRKLQAVRTVFDPQGKRCLEIGCATGENCDLLSKQGSLVTGIDLSEFAIRTATARYQPVQFLVGGIEVIKENHGFDAIFAYELIEHLPGPLSFFLKSAALLKPGGNLILSTPNLACGERLGMDKWAGLLKSFEHLYFFTPDTLAKLGHHAQFQVVAWFTGEGSGDMRSIRKDHYRNTLRRLLKRLHVLSLLRRVRSPDKRRASGPQAQSSAAPVDPFAYEPQGQRHNLLVILVSRPA
jgi:2-polyprenyl-3-methyl-5-hydroxy-6-metoxy-1,4-benzoquinol methylase